MVTVVCVRVVTVMCEREVTVVCAKEVYEMECSIGGLQKSGKSIRRGHTF